MLNKKGQSKTIGLPISYLLLFYEILSISKVDGFIWILESHTTHSSHCLSKFFHRLLFISVSIDFKHTLVDVSLDFYCRIYHADSLSSHHVFQWESLDFISCNTLNDICRSCNLISDISCDCTSLKTRRSD